jgi:hypothetical protein
MEKSFIVFIEAAKNLTGISHRFDTSISCNKILHTCLNHMIKVVGKQWNFS